LSAPTAQLQVLTFVLQTLAVVLVPLMTYETGSMKSITTLLVSAGVFATLAVLHCVRLPYYRLTGNLLVSVACLLLVVWLHVAVCFMRRMVV